MLDKHRIIISETSDPHNLDAIFRLRFETYCLMLKTERAEDHPDGRERDQWDEHAVHFAAKDCVSGEIIGCLRLVRHSGKGFPMETLFHFQVPADIEKTRCVEASRAIVTPRLAHTGVLTRIISFAQSWSTEHRYLWWCLAISKDLQSATFFQKWHIRESGPTLWYHGIMLERIIVDL